jgi:cytoskeleton protein RodZ
MSVQAGGENRSGIGTRLRAGRERKGFTVLQAAEKLHVDPKILQSLESEDFDALGAPVFVRGHLRHYAELLGEQPNELQALYANTVRVTQPDLTRIPKGKISSDPSRLVVPATVVLVAFGIAAGVWWILTLPKAHTRASSTPAASTRPVAPPASDAATEPEEPAAARLPPQSRGAAAASGGSAAARTAAATLPSSKGGGGSATEAPTRFSPAAATSGAGAPATPRAGRQAELTLRFSAESWAEVYDSSGERLFYDVGPADSVRTFKGTPPLRVVLGNAPGVAVEVNGRVTDLANLTHTDGSAQFVVSRAGRVSQSP